MLAVGSQLVVIINCVLLCDKNVFQVALIDLNVVLMKFSTIAGIEQCIWPTQWTCVHVS